jgi:hypothetical protein
LTDQERAAFDEVMKTARPIGDILQTGRSKKPNAPGNRD